MAIKVYKRNTAGRRNMSVIKPEQISRSTSEKSLTVKMNYKAGRSAGKISVRHKGGRTKRLYRMVDFRQDKLDIPGNIAAIERDPNRSALIALVHYADGEKRYVLATSKMKVGQTIITAKNAPIEDGNRLQLKNIPSSTVVCGVEFVPGKGVQMIRSAGNGALIMAVEDGYAQLKMPSGEIRIVNAEGYATIGQISNFEHSARRIGKAGRARHMGKRPAVRGSAMNPVDHPHGGGEGKQGVGLKYPKTPWGRPALGVKTRKKSKVSNKFIIKSRHKK